MVLPVWGGGLVGQAQIDAAGRTQLILSATDMWYNGDVGDFMSVVDAAKELKIHPNRVRQLLASGSLAGRLVGGRWLVSANSVWSRGHTELPLAPYSERTAWATLFALSGEPVGILLSRSERARMFSRILSVPSIRIAHLCRRRATVHALSCSAKFIPEIVGLPGVVRSGISAVSDYDIDLGGAEADLYMRGTSDIDQLKSIYPLYEGGKSNLVIRVPSRWVFGDKLLAPLAVVAVDLIDSGEPRSVAQGASALLNLVREMKLGAMGR